jgi:hypothetical protein
MVAGRECSTMRVRVNPPRGRASGPPTGLIRAPASRQRPSSPIDAAHVARTATPSRQICSRTHDRAAPLPGIPPSATLLAQPPAQPPSPATPPWLRSAPWSQLPPPVSVGLRQRSMKAQGVSLGVACCHCCKVAQDATRPISSRAAGSTASAVLMALPLVGPAAGAPRVSPREALPGRAEAGGRGPTREQASRLLRCGRRHTPRGDTPGGRG